LHPAAGDAADSVVSAAGPPPFVLGGGAGAPAASVPLVDTRDRIHGLVVVVGGGDPGTYWRPLPIPGPRWSATIDRLRRPADVGGGSEQQGRVVRGAVRAIPVSDGLLFAQTHYAWRGEGIPSIARVVVVQGDSLVGGATLLEALGQSPERLPTTPGSAPSSFREAVAAAYDAMRAALRRGDWRAFGDAFDALGRLLGPRER
jgi:hypothetical protein